MEETDIKRWINEVLDERNRVDQGTHRVHHEYVADMIRRREDRQKMWLRIRSTAIGTITVAILTGVGLFLEWIGELMIKALHIGGPHP